IRPKGASGISPRATLQVQIWDFNEPSYARNGANKGSGSLWNNSPGAPCKDPSTRADKPVGEWNSFRIIQVGERTTVYLNDQLVVDHARLENFWTKPELRRLDAEIKKLQANADLPEDKKKELEHLKGKYEGMVARRAFDEAP